MDALTPIPVLGISTEMGVDCEYRYQLKMTIMFITSVCTLRDTCDPVDTLF